MAETLDEVECDQRLMFRFGPKDLGSNLFSGRLCDRLLSKRKYVVLGSMRSGLFDLPFNWAFRPGLTETEADFLMVCDEEDAESDLEVLL